MGNGHNFTNQRISYQFTAITLGLILLGGTILGSTPFAFADDDDDRKEKLQKLKDLIKAAKDRDNDDDDPKEKLQKLKAKIKKHLDEIKCPADRKYGETCDNSKPSVRIKDPDSGDKLPAGLITIVVKAKDKPTGLKKVEVRINDGAFLPATPTGSDDLFEVDVVLGPGKYKATAKATDLADNFKRASVTFFVG